MWTSIWFAMLHKCWSCNVTSYGEIQGQSEKTDWESRTSTRNSLISRKDSTKSKQTEYTRFDRFDSVILYFPLPLQSLILTFHRTSQFFQIAWISPSTFGNRIVHSREDMLWEFQQKQHLAYTDAQLHFFHPDSEIWIHTQHERQLMKYLSLTIRIHTVRQQMRRFLHWSEPCQRLAIMDVSLHTHTKSVTHCDQTCQSQCDCHDHLIF